MATSPRKEERKKERKGTALKPTYWVENAVMTNVLNTRNAKQA